MSTFNSPRARVGQSGLFSQQTLLILVGEAREPFHIHPTQLANTAFFEMHGEPATAAEKEARLRYGPLTPGMTTPPSMSTPPVEIKREAGRSPTIEPEQRITGSGVSTAATGEDYHLVGNVFEPAAFEVIVKWLYNQPPDAPRNRPQCKTLLRAYVMALQYRIDKLQDVLVENFRKYHTGFKVDFEDLIWLINRTGDDPATHAIPMVRYFAAQIAYEITSEGYERFIVNNGFFQRFLTSGDRPIRAVIFEAIIELARTPKPADPATGLNKWKVSDNVPPRLRLANLVEMVEIDDD